MSLKDKTIAFDVQGSLIGSRGNEVYLFLEWCQSQGMRVAVWSNGVQIEKLIKSNFPKIKDVDFIRKYSKSDAQYQGMPVFDFCVDDDAEQTYLAANKMFTVYQVAKCEGNFPILFKE